MVSRYPCLIKFPRRFQSAAKFRDRTSLLRMWPVNQQLVGLSEMPTLQRIPQADSESAFYPHPSQCACMETRRSIVLEGRRLRPSTPFKARGTGNRSRCTALKTPPKTPWRLCHWIEPICNSLPTFQKQEAWWDDVGDKKRLPWMKLAKLLMVATFGKKDCVLVSFLSLYQNS